MSTDIAANSKPAAVCSTAQLGPGYGATAELLRERAFAHGGDALLYEAAEEIRALRAAVAADTELLRRALHTLVWETGSEGIFAAQTAEVLKALRARLGA